MEELAREGFVAAEEYDCGRPGYAADALDHVVRHLAIDGGSAVLDLAAGTGQLSRALGPVAGRLTALEPSAAMRAVLAARLPGVEVLGGEAEHLPFADGAFDAVVVGEAFHWFDGPEALKEIARVLQPGGGLALLWNVAEEIEPPWPPELSTLIAGHRGASVPNEHRYTSGLWRQAFDRSDRFAALSHLHAAHEQRLDRAGFVAQIASWSYIAVLPDAERAATLERVRALAPTASVTRYRTDVFWTRRLD